MRTDKSCNRSVALRVDIGTSKSRDGLSDHRGLKNSLNALYGICFSEGSCQIGEREFWFLRRMFFLLLILVHLRLVIRDLLGSPFLRGLTDNEAQHALLLLSRLQKLLEFNVRANRDKIALFIAVCHGAIFKSQE